jgi:integrase
MAKRSYNRGAIEPRGPGKFRLRYNIDGERFSKTITGTKADAQRELRSLMKAGDDGGHVAPTKITLGQWITEWLDSGAPGQRQEAVSERTLERYGQLLRTHVVPVLGDRPLQQLKAAEIDKLYASIQAASEIAPRTMHHVHTVFKSSMGTAHRTGLIATNPMNHLKKKLSAKVRISDEAEIDTDDIGEGLTEDQLKALVNGFKASSLYSIVALASSTGARRNELLALRWTDFDAEKKTVRIERALEQTKKYGIRLKPPKTARGRRTIDLDDATVRMLVVERERHLRIKAGIPDGVDVDLSLVRLPKTALIFPAMPEPGEDFDFAKHKNPRGFSKEFARRAGGLGFGSTRFHDLRGIHATALLDGGIPPHIVAQRIGDDTATLLRWYEKRRRTKAADDKLANAIGTFAAGFLGNS